VLGSDEIWNDKEAGGESSISLYMLPFIKDRLCDNLIFLQGG